MGLKYGSVLFGHLTSSTGHPTSATYSYSLFENAWPQPGIQLPFTTLQAPTSGPHVSLQDS